MNSNYRLPNPNYQQQQQQPQQWSQNQNQNQQFGPRPGPGGPNPNANPLYNQNQGNIRQQPQQNFSNPRPQPLLPPGPGPSPGPADPEEISSFPPLLPPPMPPPFPWQIDIPMVGDDPQTQPYIKVGENWELSINTGKPQVKKLNLLLYEDIIDQNLPQELRTMFQGLFCKLCSLTLSSPKVAREHYSGKRHMKCINDWLEKNKTTKDQNIQGYIRLAADKSLPKPNIQQQQQLSQQQPKSLPPPPPPPSVPRQQQQQGPRPNFSGGINQQQGPIPFPSGVNQQGPRPFPGDVNKQQQQQQPRPYAGNANQQQCPRPFPNSVNQQQQFPGPGPEPEQSQRYQNPNFYNQQQQNFNNNMYQSQQQQPQKQNFNNPNFNSNNNNFNNPPQIPSLLSQPHIRPPDFQPQQQNQNQFNNPNFDNRKRPFQGQVPSAFGPVGEERDNLGDQVHRCEICNVTVSTLPNLRDHLKGKNHLARLRQQGLPVPDNNDIMDLKRNIPRKRGPRPKKNERIARRIERKKNSGSNANLEPLGGGPGFGNSNLEPLRGGPGFGPPPGSGRFMNDEPPIILIKRRKD